MGMTSMPACTWMVVGRSRAGDPRAAGAQAARDALRQVPDSHARLMLVFSSASYDSESMLAGLCTQTPDALDVVGVSTDGEITGEEFGPDEEPAPSVVAVVLGGAALQARTRVVRRMSEDHYASGAAAAEVMTGIDAPNTLMMMFFDGLSGDYRVVRGAYSVVGLSVPIAGGCAADALEFQHTEQFHGTGAGVEVLSDAVVTVGLGSAAPIGVGLAHGWEKQGEPMVVTSSRGADILTLDGEPALDVYLTRLGVPREAVMDQVRFQDMAFQHPLGMSRRDGEDIRVIQTCDRERGSVRCLNDVPQGALVWILRADAESLMGAAKESAFAATESLDGATPAALLVFDCAGRKATLGRQRLSAEQQSLVGTAAGTPIAGFYSFGEVARTRGARGLHHLTVVTVAFG